MAAYSSPTTRNAPDFAEAYAANQTTAEPPSPLKPRAHSNLCHQFMSTGQCVNGDQCPYSHGRYDSPQHQGPRHPHPGHGPGSPMGPPRHGGRGHGGFHTPQHNMPPPPPYSALQQPTVTVGYAPPLAHPVVNPPPPAVSHGAEGAPPPPPPPPPSYQEHMANQGYGGRQASPPPVREFYSQRSNGSPVNQRASPGRLHVGTPTGEPPAYNARFRHDPYSPEGSRVVSPNRRETTFPTE